MCEKTNVEVKTVHYTKEYQVNITLIILGALAFCGFVAYVIQFAKKCDEAEKHCPECKALLERETSHSDDSLNIHYHVSCPSCSFSEDRIVPIPNLDPTSPSTLGF